MRQRISEDDLRDQINKILSERLDEFRFALLCHEGKNGIRIVHASPNNRPDLHVRIATAGLKIVSEAGRLLDGGQRLDELVLVGAAERAFIFHYGKSCLIIISVEAIGDVCYHCRWDETRHFGILPNIYASGLDSKTSVQASRKSQQQSVFMPPLPPQSSDLPLDLKAQSVQLQTDLEHELLLIENKPSERESQEDAGALTAPEADRVQKIRTFLKMAGDFTDQLDLCRFSIGVLEEIVLSRTATSWSSHPNSQSVILTRAPERDAWLAIFTSELLGRALFAVRRFFRPSSIPDLDGRPKMNGLSDQWYATSKDLGPWYASGIFYRPEKLWLATDHDPPRHDALSVELPDVAGSLLAKASRFPPLEFLKTSPAIGHISLELKGTPYKEAYRRFTILLPLSNGACVFLSAGSSSDFIRSRVLSFAGTVPKEWRNKALSNTSSNRYTKERDSLFTDAVGVSVLMSGLALSPVPPPQVEWPSGSERRTVQAMEEAGMEDYLVEVGRKIAVLAFVIGRQDGEWSATVEFDQAVLQYSRSREAASDHFRLACKLRLQDSLLHGHLLESAEASIVKAAETGALAKEMPFPPEVRQNSNIKVPSRLADIIKKMGGNNSES